MTALLVALQWLHVLFATAWLGSQIYLDTTVHRAVNNLPPEPRAAVSADLGTGRARRITLAIVTGTILFGFLRGALGGVFSELSTLYGVTWLLALALGTFMMLSVWTRGFRGRVRNPAWNALFVVQFTLMILMRFGY
jgi:hypothetical protein